jgi:hypothetical protein
LRLDLIATSDDQDMDLHVSLVAHQSDLAIILEAHLRAANVDIVGIEAVEARRLAGCRRLQAAGSSFDVTFEALVPHVTPVDDALLTAKLGARLDAVGANFEVESSSVSWDLRVWEPRTDIRVKDTESDRRHDQCEGICMVFAFALVTIGVALLVVGVLYALLRFKRKSKVLEEQNGPDSASSDMEGGVRKASKQSSHDVDDNASTVTPVESVGRMSVLSDGSLGSRAFADCKTDDFDCDVEEGGKTPSRMTTPELDGNVPSVTPVKDGRKHSRKSGGRVSACGDVPLSSPDTKADTRESDDNASSVTPVQHVRKHPRKSGSQLSACSDSSSISPALAEPTMGECDGDMDAGVGEPHEDGTKQDIEELDDNTAVMSELDVHMEDGTKKPHEKGNATQDAQDLDHSAASATFEESGGRMSLGSRAFADCNMDEFDADNVTTTRSADQE